MPLVDSEHLVLEVWTILPEHMKVFEIDHCMAKKQLLAALVVLGR